MTVQGASIEAQESPKQYRYGSSSFNHYRCRRQPANGSLIPLSLYFLLCVIAVVADAMSGRSVLIVLISSTIILPLIGRVAFGRLDVFEPLLLMDIALLVMFVGRPLADILGDSFLHDGYDIAPAFTSALVIALLGVFCFQLGYSVNARKLVSSLKTSSFQVSKGLRYASFLASGATVLFFVFTLSSGGFQGILSLFNGRSVGQDTVFRSSSGYLYTAPNACIPACILFLACALKTKKREYYLAAVLSSLPFVLLGLARGDRSTLLPLLSAIPIVAYGWKNRRPSPLTVVLCGVVFIVGAAVLRETRDVNTTTDPNVKSVELKSSVLGTLSKDDNEMFDTLANELSVVPAILPFRPFCSVTDLFVRAIPRPLYPDKPLECPDAVIDTLWPDHYQTTRGVQASSIIGNLYADSGTLGVCLGMFAIGFCSRLCWDWYQLNSLSLTALVLYSMIPALLVILLRGTFPDTAGRSLFTLMPLVMFATTGRRRRIEV